MKNTHILPSRVSYSISSVSIVEQINHAIISRSNYVK